jgi:3-(3-hydroxy-phenyl)propionate hydroxylase
MIPQPDVVTLDGVRRKLDDVLGGWFSIIGWQCDPHACLSHADRAYWVSLGARFVQINRSRSGVWRRTMSNPHGTECVEDVDNAIADWFDRHAKPLVVVRPDRYVAVQTDAVGMADATAAFRAFAPQLPGELHVC